MNLLVRSGEVKLDQQVVFSKYDYIYYILSSFFLFKELSF